MVRCNTLLPPPLLRTPACAVAQANTSRDDDDQVATLRRSEPAPDGDALPATKRSQDLAAEQRSLDEVGAIISSLPGAGSCHADAAGARGLELVHAREGDDGPETQRSPSTVRWNSEKRDSSGDVSTGVVPSTRGPKVA